ncbi:MAG: type II secretion system F family protein [Candidatus Kerfeldbacteria bacterium]|nr:type II secretion system F family protein [Candidatus Kerfeldbacteria bacterium]
MPSFHYQATDRKGNAAKGDRNAADIPALAASLSAEGLTLQHAEDRAHRTTMNSIDRALLKLSRVKLVEKVFFVQNLQVMLRAGFSIARALHTLGLQTPNKYFQMIIDDLQRQVEAGVSFAKALRTYPKVFPELIVNMIDIGEVSGKLDDVLRQIALQLRKEHAIKTKVRGALIYPVIVVIAMVGIGIAMLVFVIPKVSAIYLEVDAKLPLATRVLIATSNFIVGNGVLVVVLTTITVIVLIRVGRVRRVRFLLHRLSLRTPVLGPIVQKINLARFTRTLSSMLETDVPIVKALSIIATTLTNLVYRSYVERSAEQLKRGISISKSLEGDARLFPPLVTQMLSVGEESGSLDKTTAEIAAFYEEDVDQTMGNLSTIIEPVLMVVLGIGVGAMAIAIIMPMYSLASVI